MEIEKQVLHPMFRIIEDPEPGVPTFPVAEHTPTIQPQSRRGIGVECLFRRCSPSSCSDIVLGNPSSTISQILKTRDPRSRRDCRYPRLRFPRRALKYKLLIYAANVHPAFAPRHVHRFSSAPHRTMDRHPLLLISLQQ